MAHDLYKDGDADLPEAILDRNGQVVLGMCKICHKGEIELSEPCVKGGDPDWSTKCENCDAVPTVHPVKLCGPCCFGEAETANGNW